MGAHTVPLYFLILTILSGCSCTYPNNIVNYDSKNQLLFRHIAQDQAEAEQENRPLKRKYILTDREDLFEITAKAICVDRSIMRSDSVDARDNVLFYIMSERKIPGNPDGYFKLTCYTYQHYNIRKGDYVNFVFTNDGELYYISRL